MHDSKGHGPTTQRSNTADGDLARASRHLSREIAFQERFARTLDEHRQAVRGLNASHVLASTEALVDMTREFERLARERRAVFGNRSLTQLIEDTERPELARLAEALRGLVDQTQARARHLHIVQHFQSEALEGALTDLLEDQSPVRSGAREGVLLNQEV